ncbi:hypothetical protein J7T55_002732 [Diaporthe amygdali]|uniref:uncharacterized protein n=1 Tax=Phomopsis amygdali TaxID=1214568 RepID=UPI0022FE8188|nr:uncharacterized protein J7T55_002732 [Diaporthe amygdali]KAJ0122220.1 hypothetical protein J7T55_002732 [Diaporthe amygdali]
MWKESEDTPGEARDITNQAGREKSSAQIPPFLGEIPGETADLNQGQWSGPEKRYAKMGSMFSKIAKHIGSDKLAGGDSMGIMSPVDFGNDYMTPRPDEMPSRPGSTSSITESATSNDNGLDLGLFWPYVSSGQRQRDTGSEHPLRLRRPALYEEYWA